MNSGTLNGADTMPSALCEMPGALPELDASALPVAHGSLHPPDRYRALASADPAQQLGDALTQIDALLGHNAKLNHQIFSLQRSLATAAHLALHDELTGLANRRLLVERFRDAVAQGSDPETTVALAFLDLDGFKRVNDTLGHAAGDKLLKLVAKRLVEGIREGDTACRFGGDEFIVLLTGVVGRDGAQAALGHINNRLVEPYLIGGASIAITASTGLAVYPSDGEDFEQLLQVSDRGMCQEKAGQAGSPNGQGIAEDPQPRGDWRLGGNGIADSR